MTWRAHFLALFLCAQIDTRNSQSCDLTHRVLNNKYFVLRFPALFVVTAKTVAAEHVNIPAQLDNSIIFSQSSTIRIIQLRHGFAGIKYVLKEIFPVTAR